MVFANVGAMVVPTSTIAGFPLFAKQPYRTLLTFCDAFAFKQIWELCKVLALLIKSDLLCFICPAVRPAFACCLDLNALCTGPTRPRAFRILVRTKPL